MSKRAKIAVRSRMARRPKYRVVVRRSHQHMYSQLVDPSGKVLFGVSTQTPDLRESLKYAGNIAAAQVVGQALGKKILDQGIKQVAFDRSGYVYHGRVAAVAEGLRESGVVV